MNSYDSFTVGVIVGFCAPVVLLVCALSLKVYKLHRNRKIDAKRRKTFKIVQK